MITKYLFEHYYSQCNRLDLIPTPEQIEQALINHPDKIIIIKDSEIRGMCVFFTLTDKTYSFLHNIDIQRIDTLQALALENGKNFHAVLMVSDGYKTMRSMYRNVMKLKPKTLSWWNPDFTKLHRYICHQ